MRRSGVSTSWARRRVAATSSVEPYFQKATPDQVVLIIKAREPANIMTVIVSDSLRAAMNEFDEKMSKDSEHK